MQKVIARASLSFCGGKDCKACSASPLNHSGPRQPRLLKHMVPALAGNRLLLRSATCAQHHFGGDRPCKSQARLMSHVGVPQQRVRPPKPQIIGESILAHAWPRRRKCISAFRANSSRLLTGDDGWPKPALVQQNQLRLRGRAHLDS